MDSKKIQAATIVSSSHPASWSQAYTAGNLFAVVSLTKTEKDNAEIDMLAVIGKEILNTLEAEYFTLETKDLESIQNAITVATKNALGKEDVVLSACFTSVVENALYIFALGETKIYMQRQDKLGLLLLGQEPTISSASGFLQPNDVVILQTKEFGEVISKEKLAIVLEEQQKPTEIAEYLSPLIHEHEKGGAAAVVFLYEEEIIAVPEIITPKPPRIQIPDIKKVLQKMPKLPHIELTGKRKLFLGICLTLIILLIFSVVYTNNQKEKAIQQALFQEVYAAAQKKFDTGQGLSGLNKNLARDDLTQAQKIILENKEKFANNKVLKDKLGALLKNIEDSLLTVSGVNRVDAKPVDVNANIMLSIALETKPHTVAQDDKTIYTIDDKEITSFDKKTKSKKTLVSNKDSWSTVGGIGALGAYIGNLYVLDRDAGQILKFVGSNSSNYLSSKQDLSKATSIAIDGSIWILYSDGNIQKWTRGKQDAFAVSGLDEKFNNPTRIFTASDTDNLYILDNGNNRIVVLSKTGVYQTQYQSDVLKTTIEFDVLEKDKKAFVLSNGKLWQIELK